MFDTTEQFKKFGRLVREERKRQGLTQLELANLAGCGITFVTQLECGKTSLRMEKVVELLAVLGLELQVAVGKSGLVTKKQTQK